MKIFLLSLFFIISFTSVKAQDLDEVFNDDGISNIKSSVNISASDLIEGYINIGYNRHFYVSDEVGVAFGIYAFNGQPMYLEYGEGPNISGLHFESGYIFRFRLRRYFGDYEGFFWQFGFNYRMKKINNIEYKTLSVSLVHIGYRYQLAPKMGVSAYSGFGAYFKNQPSYGLGLDYLGVFIPLYMEFSYDF